MILLPPWATHSSAELKTLQLFESGSGSFFVSHCTERVFCSRVALISCNTQMSLSTPVECKYCTYSSVWRDLKERQKGVGGGIIYFKECKPGKYIVCEKLSVWFWNRKKLPPAPQFPSCIQVIFLSLFLSTLYWWVFSFGGKFLYHKWGRRGKNLVAFFFNLKSFLGGNKI